MTSSLQQSSSSSVGLPNIQHNSEDGSSDSQVTVKEKITKEIISKYSEAPFLPKVRGGLHLQLARHQERNRKKKEKPESAATEPAEKKAAWNYELSPDTTAGILEIFARSVDHHFTVDKMWSELKADALKRLRPIILHSHRLNRRASPSAKQCLEIYKKPTAIDQYTGKPIPLGQVLSEVTRRMYTSQGTMSAINVAMSQVARLSQMKAEMMLERKDPYNPMETSVHQDWYFTPQERHLDSTGTSSRPKTRTTDRKHRPLRVRRIEGGAKYPKKRLPCYLTSNGSLLSASLEEFEGEVLYCTPSQKSKSEQQEDEDMTMHRDNSSSVFLTDIVCPPSARSEKHIGGTTLLIPISAAGKASSGTDRATTATSRATTSRATTSRATTSRATTSRTTTRTTTGTTRVTTDKSTPSSGVRVTTWQPLNTTALLEHTTVSQIPITGLGHLAHGHYQMWRPESCHTHIHTHIIENSINSS